MEPASVFFNEKELSDLFKNEKILPQEWVVVDLYLSWCRTLHNAMSAAFVIYLTEMLHVPMCQSPCTGVNITCINMFF